MRILAWWVIGVVGCAPGNRGTTGSSTTGGSNGGTGASVTSTGMSGSNGGTVGSTGSSGGTTGGAACTPFSSWCDGNMLMNCTRSGMDATGFDCNKLTSSMYTYTCVDQCPNQASTYGPCCYYTSGTTGSTGGTTGSTPKPTCVAAITAPVAVSGDNTNFAKGVYCSAPSAPDCPNMGTGSVTFSDSPKTCPPTGWSATITWYRASTKLGAAQTPGTNIYVTYVDVANSANDCSAWSGNVTLVSDTPSWKVTFDLTCTGGASVHLAGTLSGDVSP